MVTNVSNQIDRINRLEIKKIFLGERIHWKDGSKIKIADNLNKKTADKFFSTFIGQNSSRIKKIWIKKMLRGKMSPPESFKNRNDLLDYISTRKHCIGFISPGKLPDGVKIIEVVDKK